MYFHLKLNQTYNALLGAEPVARDSWSPPPVHGSIHKSRSAYSKIPKRLFHPFQALVPSFHIIGPPHPWIFHPIRGLSTSNRIDEYVQRSMDGDYPHTSRVQQIHSGRSGHFLSKEKKTISALNSSLTASHSKSIPCKTPKPNPGFIQITQREIIHAPRHPASDKTRRSLPQSVS